MISELIKGWLLYILVTYIGARIVIHLIEIGWTGF